MDFKSAIAEQIVKALGESPLTAEEIAGFIEIPPDTNMGDFAFPCFKLSKALRKSPVMISDQLAAEISAGFLSRVESVKGYLNFFVDKATYAREIVDEVMEKGQKYGADNSGNGKTVNVTYTLSGAAAGNYELTATTETVKANITTASTSYYSGLMSGMSESNVDSGDKSTLKAIIGDIDVIVTDSNLSSSARGTFTNIQMQAENLIDRIESAEGAKTTAGVRGSEAITAENVKVTDKSVLSKAQTDLNTALNSYGGNYTAAEKSAAEADLSRITAALSVLTKVEDVEKQINDLSDTPDATAVTAARDAYNGLSDYEKTLVSVMALNKLERAEGNPVTTPTATPDADKIITNQNGDDVQDNKETIDIPFGLILGVAAVACGGAGFWFYRKRKFAAEEDTDEDLNW